ncbi:MAG: DNA alkylation repair protein [Flavobacteriaceae bacterium]|nr:DNA alkylation repair protein [Flavobacteriaceae bacterium]
MNYAQQVIDTLSAHAAPEVAQGQAAYMKNKFQFFGLKAPQRRILYNPFLKKTALPNKLEAIKIAKLLYAKPERELHYFAMELMYQFRKNSEITDSEWIEFLITHNSWWDTVDYIADKLAGNYFINFPEQIEPITKKWIMSNDIWLKRSALLFQLKYKEKTKVDLLSDYILKLSSEKEFFIRKAIGWILREYSATNPEWVKNFVAKNEDKLSDLSKKEALRNLN